MSCRTLIKMQKEQELDNPYEPALVWIRKDPTTGSATGLAKLILSLWNDDAAFSFRECVRSFYDIRAAWALKIIDHFLKHGEDRLLQAAGKEVSELCPPLWKLGFVGTDAKHELLKQWDREREERYRREFPEDSELS
jgi:hypothetical protein